MAMASSITPCRHGISRHRQSRTESRPWLTRAENPAKIARVVLEICSQDCRLICSELAVNGNRSGQVLPAGECVCNVVSTTPGRCRPLPSLFETISSSPRRISQTSPFSPRDAMLAPISLFCRRVSVGHTPLLYRSTWFLAVCKKIMHGAWNNPSHHSLLFLLPD